jgi:hypothetical protein
MMKPIVFAPAQGSEEPDAEDDDEAGGDDPAVDEADEPQAAIVTAPSAVTAEIVAALARRLLADCMRPASRR